MAENKVATVTVTEADKEVEETKVKKTKAKKAEKVSMHLFKDNDKYNQDVVVGINGKKWQIKRGVDVEVPPEVAEVIRNSEAQKGLTENALDEKAAEFEAESKKYE